MSVAPRRKAVARAPREPIRDAARVRERILSVFSSKAKRSGIRAVVMGELAAELRMSAVTLYKHFASKDELVSAMVDAWALELAAIDALDLGRGQRLPRRPRTAFRLGGQLDRRPRERLAGVL